MKDSKVKKIDFSRKRYGDMADKFYNEGNYLSALRFAHKQLETYGGDGDVYTRLCDIYEGMSLLGSALKWWFRFLDIAEEEDLPDIYEGIAVNFLNLGNESQSAFYYNKLIDADDTLPDETKLDIAEAFSVSKRDKFRFVYPPQLADYSKEFSLGSRALKAGNCERAIEEFSKIAKGSKEYVSAQEMQAVALLLVGKAEEAESVCVEVLKEHPDNVRIQATLAAVYLEEGRPQDSKEIALLLAAQEQKDADDIYKVATVCCENDLHDEAYKKFCLLDEKMPYDGRMLYFKAVAAYKSGRIHEAERTLDTLCCVYPDAEVAKYYLRAIRDYVNGETDIVPELIYFYHLPQEERENRCRSLIHIGECPKDEAQLFGVIALHDGYFHWCFDEMDGGDHDLQYLALVAASKVRADEFIRDILLDPDVIDVLKIETLRMLLERNEETELGVVLCNIYRRLTLHKIKIGRKKRKRFIEAYAKIASKFVAISDTHGEKIKAAAEELYRALESYQSLDLITSSDDCACAIFMTSGLKELGNNVDTIAAAFDANAAKVKVLTSVVTSKRYGIDKDGETEKKDEDDGQ
ncbi:MAG: tetratricopeptide repeat protein [Clostridia bacterium]|nr:tetratricopeptide repeat protein [Clostridia bacterium]